MSPLDQADFAERIRILRQAVADLQRYRRDLTLDQFLADRDAQYMVLHAFYVATQAMIDLALQACSVKGRVTDGTYKDAFRVLAGSGDLDAAAADRLTGWAGFRNVVAHLYASLDLTRTHAALDEVDDLANFADWAERLLRSGPGG